MANRSRRDTDRVDAMMESIYPISRDSLRTGEIERAQEEIAAAIVAMPQRSARAKRWQWLARPRHVMLIGAVVAGLGGSIAAAASFLSAHTGQYPTKMGVPLAMAGPGEDLNTQAPDFCRVAFQVSSDIPFPARYASWRDSLLSWQYGIKHVTSSIPCGSRGGGFVGTGRLGELFAASAFCGWAQAWAHDVGSGDRAGAAQAARVISQALDWRAVRWVDPHPDDAPGGDAPGGSRTKTEFGWVLFYQRAVRSGTAGVSSGSWRASMGTANAPTRWALTLICPTSSHGTSWARRSRRPRDPSCCSSTCGAKEYERPLQRSRTRRL
jgi:hypothetical protein